MKPYIGIVHKDEDSAYGVTFPDAPGCFSAADEMDDLFDAAQEALGAWLDSMLANRLPVPPARELSEIRADAHWQESLASSEFLIAVPVPPRAVRQKAA